MTRTQIVLALAFLVLAGGCGSGLAPVSGTVTLDGKPLTKGNVCFIPAASGPSAYGTISSDGTYQLQTGVATGLAPGEYRVTVASAAEIPAPTPQNPEPVPVSLLPPKYASAETSGLKFTVTSSGGKFDIPLTSK
jgi:hypothetical protein